MDELEFDGLNEDQKKVAISIYKQIEDKLEAKYERKLKDLKGEDILPEDPKAKAYAQDAKRLTALTKLWKNNGFADGAREQVTFDQLFARDVEVTKQMRDNTSTDHPLLIPRVIANMAREAIEPALTITPLLQRMNYTHGTVIRFPAISTAMQAAEMGEGEEYPEGTFELAGQTEATIGKQGIAFKVTEEVIRYNLFDVVGILSRSAGKAMARLKEQKAVDLITADYGTTIIDNSTATYKSSTGRDALGAYNGTLALDDLFYAYAVMVDRGFMPDTLIMHPFAWQIFAQEGFARAFGWHNGMADLIWRTAQGPLGNAPQWRAGGLNQNTYVTNVGNVAGTFTNVPSPFPLPFRIVVSPYMPYTASTARTDIVLCNSSELGLLIVDEELTTDEWDDPARDIKKIKMRERYGMAMVNDGKGIGLLKSIKIAKSFDFADKIELSLTGLTNDLTGDASNVLSV